MQSVEFNALPIIVSNVKNEYKYFLELDFIPEDIRGFELGVMKELKEFINFYLYDLEDTLFYENQVEIMKENIYNIRSEFQHKYELNYYHAEMYALLYDVLNDFISKYDIDETENNLNLRYINKFMGKSDDSPEIKENKSIRIDELIRRSLELILNIVTQEDLKSKYVTESFPSNNSTEYKIWEKKTKDGVTEPIVLQEDDININDWMPEELQKVKNI